LSTIFYRVSILKQKFFCIDKKIIYIKANKEIPIIFPKIEIRYIILSDETELERLSVNKYFKKQIVKIKNFLKNGCKIYIAVDNNNIIGYYIISKILDYKPHLYLNNSLFEGDNKYFIFFCNTLFEYQRKNIYSYMLTQICKDFIKNHEEVFISTEAENIAAQKGIIKAGFEKLGVLKHFEIKYMIYKSELIKSCNTT
jgi:hypothetical protein